MKKLDKYILKEFLPLFVVVFFVVLFILIMQFFWKYIGEFAGKGLDVSIILELLFYTSFNLVPMAVPLCILLSCIMVFGGFGERYELTAIKSAGIPLVRAMAPIGGFVVLVSIGMYFFIEKVVPYGNYKSMNMKENMIRKNASAQFEPGVFETAIPGYFIRVNSKSGKDNKILNHVFIQKSSSFNSNQETIIAKKGEIKDSPNPSILVLELTDGNAYIEDIKGKNRKEKLRQPMQKMSFKKLTQYIDISALTGGDVNKEISKTEYEMLSSRQLLKGYDSLSNIKNEKIKYYNKSAFLKLVSTTKNKKPSLIKEKILDIIPAKEKVKILDSSIKNITNKIDSYKKESDTMDWIIKQTNLHMVWFWKRFSIPFSCIVLFLTGGSLGSIIRKGGLGVPLVVAVIIFVIYYIVLTLGENLTGSGKLSPFMGNWLAPIVLFPFGLYMTYKANIDHPIGLPNFGKIKKLLQKK